MWDIPALYIVDVLCSMPSAEHQKLERAAPAGGLEGLGLWWKVQGAVSNFSIHSWTGSCPALCHRDRLDGGGSIWAGCAWNEVTLPGTQKCK